MYIKEKYSSALAKILINYDHVYLDTCSLMEEGFPEFMDYLEGSKEYWNREIEIVVFPSVIFELKKHIDDKDKPNLSIDAKRAYKIIKQASSKIGGRLITIESGDEQFADQEISANVIKNRLSKKILVITQDRKLATDLRKFNSFDSQHGKYVEVYRVRDDGTLELTPNESILQRRNISKPTKTEKPLKTTETIIIRKEAPKTSAPLKPASNAKPAETKTEPAPKPSPEPESKLYSAQSKTIFDGVVDSLNYLHVIVRDDSVPYVKQVHGPYDLTNDSVLKLIDGAKKDQKGNMSFGFSDLNWSIEKSNGKYVVSLKKTTEKSQKEAGSAVKNDAKTANKEVKPQKAKQEQPKQEKPKSAESKKPAEKPTKPEQATNSSKFLEEAKKSELRLGANIKNPNYATEKKIADIDEHLKLLKKIPKANREGLKFDTPELNKIRQELTQKAKDTK